MKIFFEERVGAGDIIITLNPEESHHAVKSLRSQKGERVAVLNGKGSRFIAEIVNPDPRSCELRIIEHERQSPPRPHLQVALAQLKNRERMEWWVEKAVELGASSL